MHRWAVGGLALCSQHQTVLSKFAKDHYITSKVWLTQGQLAMLYPGVRVLDSRCLGRIPLLGVTLEDIELPYRRPSLTSIARLPPDVIRNLLHQHPFSQGGPTAPLQQQQQQQAVVNVVSSLQTPLLPRLGSTLGTPTKHVNIVATTVVAVKSAAPRSHESSLQHPQTSHSVLDGGDIYDPAAAASTTTATPSTAAGRRAMLKLCATEKVWKPLSPEEELYVSLCPTPATPPPSMNPRQKNKSHGALPAQHRVPATCFLEGDEWGEKYAKEEPISGELEVFNAQMTTDPYRIDPELRHTNLATGNKLSRAAAMRLIPHHRQRRFVSTQWLVASEATTKRVKAVTPKSLPQFKTHLGLPRKLAAQLQGSTHLGYAEDVKAVPLRSLEQFIDVRRLCSEYPLWGDKRQSQYAIVLTGNGWRKLNFPGERKKSALPEAATDGRYVDMKILDVLKERFGIRGTSNMLVDALLVDGTVWREQELWNVEELPATVLQELALPPRAEFAVQQPPVVVDAQALTPTTELTKPTTESSSPQSTATRQLSEAGCGTAADAPAAQKPALSSIVTPLGLPSLRRRNDADDVSFGGAGKGKK